MKSKLVLFAVCCWLSAAGAQPAPDTIVLPDSLGPLRPGYHVAFGSSTNNIYVASESSDIIVVDGETFQRIKRINTGTPVGGALLVAQHNKLYCSYPSQGRIGAIDCASNSVAGSIQVGTRPTLLCHSSGSDKLYCGDTIDNTVTVISCAADTVVEVIAVGDGLTAMAYDPTTAKVYVATGSAVLAISCATDSIVATISAVKAAIGLCVNQRRQKLYAVGPDCGSQDTVFVISTSADSLTSKMWWPYEGVFLPGLACYDAADRIYGALEDAGSWHLLEFDCSGDTLTRDYYMQDFEGRGIVCDTLRNRLYYLCDEQDRGIVFDVDCATWDIVSTTRTEDYPAVLELDQDKRRLLCTNWRDDEENILSVYDCTDDSLERRAVPLQGWQGSTLCHNSVAGKLYYYWGYAAGGIGIVDEQTNKVVALVAFPYGCGRAMAYSRTSDKLYCPTSPGLAVLDGTSDSLLKLVDFGGVVLQTCWYPDSNKLYCFVNGGSRYYIAVLDCNTDNVVREIERYTGSCQFELLPKDLMLCNYGEGLMLIDCRSDSVLSDTVIPGNIYDITHSSNGEVYMIHRLDRLEVLSAGSISLLATIDWPYSGRQNLVTLACSDSTHKLYWFAGDSILVIDSRGDTVLKRIEAITPLAAGCLDRTGRYAFCVAWYSVVIYDMQSDSYVAEYPALPYPLNVVLNPELGRIYVACPDAVLVYPDTPPGICDEPAISTSPGLPPQTVVRNVLFLPEAVGLKSQAASLMDATGRKVLDLKRGANDVRALAPGVYFVREASGLNPAASSVRKVVLTE